MAVLRPSTELCLGTVGSRHTATGHWIIRRPTGFYASAFFLTRTYKSILYLMLGLGIGSDRFVGRQPYCQRLSGYHQRDIGQPY